MKRPLLVLTGIAAMVGAAAANTEPASESTDVPHRYEVALSDDLATLTVQACPAGAPTALTARHAAAGDYLHAVHDANGGALRVSNGQIALTTTACVSYVVKLDAATRSNPRYTGIGNDNVALPIDAWLWRPRGQGARATQVRFALPAGMQVSVPWLPITAEGDAFRIPPSPASDYAVSVFGRFKACLLPVAGATLRVAGVSGRVAARGDELLHWIRGAAENVARVYGRFPNPAPQVVLIPVASGLLDGGEPVPFGHVIRDGGEAVQFFVNQRRRLAAFAADWTATHEFAHLLIPYVHSDEKWISEGLASYYQNVLMARAGAYAPAKAWRKLIEGFRRGENSVPHLSLENAMPIGGWDGIMKTYWGGAVIFLMADVALRRTPGDVASLDAVLERLADCCLPSSRSWRGRRLFRKLDDIAGRAVFEPLYDRHRAQRAFPAYADLLRELGVSLGGTRTSFDQDAPLAAIRDAIMAPVKIDQNDAAPLCTGR